MSKRKFCSFHWSRSILYFWRIWDSIMLIWKIKMVKLANIITAVTLFKTIKILQLKQLDLHNNLLIFLTLFQLNIQMQFMSDVTSKESILCKLWLWVQMAHLMDMELIFLISTSMILIQTIHQKLTSQPLEMDKSDSIQISTVVEKYASVFLEHGEEVPWKIGIQKFLLFCKFLSLFNPSLCLNKFTLMNLDSNTNKEPLKVKRKIKLMQTSLDMVTSNLQWFKILKIHQKDLNILSRDISILKKIKFLKKQRSGSSTLKREKLHTMD